MAPEPRRELQNERLVRMIGRIFDGPVPLFRDKLRGRRGHLGRRHHHRRRSGRGAAHRQAGPSGLGGRPSRPGAATGSPIPRAGGAARHLDRHDRPTDHHRLDQAGPLDRVRVRCPQLVADGLPPGNDRDPRPSCLPLRGRGHAAGDLRVPRPALAVGPAAGHRRARRTGGALLDPGHPRHPVHGLRHRPVHRGGHQARHPPGGCGAHRSPGPIPASGSAGEGCRS